MGLLLLGAAVTALLVPRSEAAGTCGTYGNYFDGGFHEPSSGQVYGARADINLRDTDLCSGTVPDKFSNAWSMIARDGAPGWAQIGYEHNKFGSNPRVLKHFWQNTQDGTPPLSGEYFGSPSVGDKKHYKVTISSDNKLHMFICDADGGANCVEKQATNWNPFNVGWSGTNAQFFGEVGHLQDDIVGNPTFRTNFSAVEEIKATGSWFSGAISLVKDSSRWSYESVSNSHFKIWTSTP